VAIDKVVSASITDSSVTDAKLSFNSNQFRNIIINGDMSIAQRGTSVTWFYSSGYILLIDIDTQLVLQLGLFHNQLMYQLVKVLQNL
jgi:hypothetical protein